LVIETRFFRFFSEGGRLVSASARKNFWALLDAPIVPNLG